MTTTDKSLHAGFSLFPFKNYRLFQYLCHFPILFAVLDNTFLPPAFEGYGKVMFSGCLTFCSQGDPTPLIQWGTIPWTPSFIQWGTIQWAPPQYSKAPYSDSHRIVGNYTGTLPDPPPPPPK